MNKDIKSQELVLVLTNESNHEKAYSLAEILLEKKLICCVSFKKVESHYWWKGSINKEDEIQLFMKSKQTNLNRLFQVISEFHSYEVPEIIWLSANCSHNYSKWAIEVMT